MNDDTTRGPQGESSSWGKAWGSEGMEDLHEEPTPTGGRDPKSPTLAGLLALFPGIGHLYLGAVQRGLVFTGMFMAIVFALNSYEFRPLQPLLGLGLPFLVVYNIVDAVRGARAINRAATSGRPAPEFGVPWVSRNGEAGGRTAGWVLIGLGVLLLGVTRFDLDLRWLVEWWPVILIVLGWRMLSRERRQD